MKKKLTTATLLLISALAATSCDEDSVTLKEDDNGNSIVFSIQVGGNTINYTADELLKDFQDLSTAKSGLYGEVSRQVFTQYGEKLLTDNGKSAKLASLRADAEDDVDEFKEDCKDNASDAGTDYDSYLEDALESAGVTTLEELEDLYYYNGLKSEVLDDYLEETNHYNYFLEKYLDAYTPFQVKHILVAANSADTKYATGTMTTTNANKLLSVLKRFINGDAFESIAEITDDTSSADNGGVMPFNEAQNYVSEFRFATYAQEIFANNQDAQSRYEVAAKLHIIDKEETSVEEFQESNLYEAYKNGIGTVSLSEIMKLDGEVKSTMAGAFNYYTSNDAGEITDTPKTAYQNNMKSIADQPYSTSTTDEEDDDYYYEYELERNVIFNNTLNNHKVQYIAIDGDYATSMTKNVTTVKVNGVDTKVLADDAGNPIFVALASTGIHFMSMVWNSFNPLDGDYTSQYISDEALESFAKIISDQKGTTVAKEDLTAADLNKAYFTLYDEDSDLAGDFSAYQYTYIGRNGAYNSKSSLTSNSSSLLSSISSYVSSVEYYLFDALVYNQDNGLENSTFKVSFYDSAEANEIYDLIKDYVQDQLNDDSSFADDVKNDAEAYADKLARAEEVKEAWTKKKLSV